MQRTLVAVLILLTLLAGSARAAGPEGTRAALERQMRYAGAYSGALAVDLGSGAEIYASRADTARVPASVEKLYTTATALLRLGPQAQFETTVLAEAPILPDGSLEGPLYLRGGGDPALGRAALETLAADLAAAGLLEVEEGVVGDESRFDARRGPAGFGVDGWVGPLGALVYNRGRTGVRRPYWQASPARFAAEAFARALKREGIKVAVRDSTRGTTPPFATSLAAWRSPTVAELARRSNVPSDNFVAEMLIKAVADAPASTSAGARVVRATLSGLGLSPRIADGSGLSRANRTTPRQVVRLLTRMAEGSLYGPFQSSLAVAGRTGTLKDRMRRSAARDRCRGKTGSLIGVSALAGYCRTRGGATVAYAFLMNGVSTWGARRLQDRMLDALARYSP